MNTRSVSLCTLALAGFLLSTFALPAAAQKDPKALIAQVVDAVGGANALQARQDVEYTYIHRQPTGKMDVSVERYAFDGELSWALYPMHETYLEDHQGTPVVQGYDGKASWISVGGQRQEAPQLLKLADFRRKTNFYWFAMMHKLLDPGCIYNYEGTREHAGTTYELVKMTFETGVGDVSDTYLLYINPETHLIDRFLFTVLDFGREQPLLMEVSYEEVDGVQLSTYRRYTPASDWQGTPEGGDDATWAEEISVGVRFRNGFDRGLFAPPAAG